MKTLSEASLELYRAAKGLLESIALLESTAHRKGDWMSKKEENARSRLKKAVESYSEIRCKNLMEKIRQAWTPDEQT